MTSGLKGTMGCFLIGATGKGNTSDGNAIIGSVSDDPYDIRTYLRIVSPNQGQPHIGTELSSTTEHTLTDRGYFAKPGETTRGINQAGLAFTCAMIIEDETVPRLEVTTEYSNLTGTILRDCTNVREAIDVFKAAGKVRPAYTVLLADAAGGLAQLEVGYFGVNVNHLYSRGEPGNVFSVNCYLSSALEQFNTPHTKLEDESNNNKKRLVRGQQLAQNYPGRINVQALAFILSDHANREIDPMQNPILEGWGYSICNHGTRSRDDFPQENLPWGTVSSEILEPAAGRFWYAYGWPCGEEPGYGDQIYQQNSWGRFLPFRIPKQITNNLILPLTSVEGVVTAAGATHLAYPGATSST